MKESDYAELRERCISKYSKLYNDTLAFDLCRVPKDIRIRLLNDSEYLSETKAARAELFESQIDILDDVIRGSYAGDEARDQSQTVLKALEMKQRLLLQDISDGSSEADALNVTFTEMDEDTFTGMDTVSVTEGSNTDLGADFSAGDDGEESFEARMKREVKEKLSKLDENKEE